MSEEMNTEKSHGSQEGSSGEEAEAARKRRLKKLVYANLVGAGLLSAVGFSASAHGNASSHTGTRISWNVDDFTVKAPEKKPDPISPKVIGPNVLAPGVVTQKPANDK